MDPCRRLLAFQLQQAYPATGGAAIRPPVSRSHAEGRQDRLRSGPKTMARNDLRRKETPSRALRKPPKKCPPTRVSLAAVPTTAGPFGARERRSELQSASPPLPRRQAIRCRRRDRPTRAQAASVPSRPLAHPPLPAAGMPAHPTPRRPPPGESVPTGGEDPRNCSEVGP